jgi:ATP-dependent helicase/nuclease subunit A
MLQMAMSTMNDAGTARDAAERARALDTARSFIVQAPAGSGKTELLLQRYLALLARVAQPEAIVAMTFTRKAAGEIRDRVLGALRTAGTDEPPTDANRALTWRLARAVLERDRARAWNLVAHPARMRVHTIDALCLMLMRQAPLAVKLGALPQLSERAERMYVEAARAELAAAAATDDSWQRLLDYLDNDADRLVALIAELLGKREQWLPHLVTDDVPALRAALEAALRAEIDTELRELSALLPQPVARSLAKLRLYAARNLAAGGATHPLAMFPGSDKLPPADVAGLPHWQAIAGWLLTKKGTIRQSVNKKHGFPGHGSAGTPGFAERAAQKHAMEDLLSTLSAIPGLPASLHIVRSLPPSQYDDSAWKFIAALLAVLPRVAARLRVVFAQANAIDFSEATLITLHALGNGDAPSELLLALDARIEHLLVDEFQDTSLAQYDLIRALTAGWEPGDGRTLFVVGDPMQSIYRFRAAEVNLYLEVRRSGRIGSVVLEPLTLARNFRSQCGLVEWVNATFLRLLAARASSRGTVAFTTAVAARGPGAEPATTLDLCTDSRQEAAVVVGRVKAALASDAQDIAVLVRRRADLAEILPALRNAGIGYAAVDLDRLSERQAVLDIAALAHALLQPDDRAAWLAVMRAPWCALTLPDLFAVVRACDSGTLCDAVATPRRSEVLSRLSADGRLRFERFATVVAAALAQRGRLPFATMVRAAWLALGGPACTAEAIDLAAAERVFALLREHALGADVPDWAGFGLALNELYAEPEGAAAAAVRIMTLHRAKGLEFDVVVMPGLARRPPHGVPQLLLWRRRLSGLLLAPIRARGSSNDDRVYAYLRALAVAEDEAELGRLLYVGCTRAKGSLHLTATLDEEGTGADARWKPPVRGSALAALWPALAEQAAPRSAAAGATRALAATRGVPLLRLPLQWQLPPAPGLDVTPLPEVQTLRESVEFDWVREAARRIGTVAHRLLRRIGAEGIERWTPDRVAAERAPLLRELAARGFTGAEADAAVEQVLAAVQTTLTDARGRWLFDPAHADARSEFAVTHWREGAFVHGVLDRTFIAADGTRWIVDFKLSRHEGGGSEAFLDNERERYRAQLEAYAEAMRALDPRPIRLGLYFPLLAAWREWPAVDALADRV